MTEQGHFEGVALARGGAERLQPTLATTGQLETQPVNARMQDAAVGSKLLQRAVAAAGGDNRGQVIRLELIVHEMAQRFAGVVHAFKRHAQIVHHQGNAAMDIFPSQSARGWSANDGAHRSPQRHRSDIREVSNLARLTVFE